MKFIVALAFGAGILVVLSNASCMRSKVKPINGIKPRGCSYNKKMYAVNSHWRTEDCLDCTCYPDGNYECCHAYGTPVNYDEERCFFIFDKQNCEYRLIPNEDTDKQCESYDFIL